MIITEDREVIEQLRQNLGRWKQNFDRGVHVQNAINIADLESQFKQYGTLHAYNITLQNLTSLGLSVDVPRRGISPRPQKRYQGRGSKETLP